MAVDFNHTIVWVRDSQASATFLSEVLGLPSPRRWGPFLVVTTANGTNLDFMDADGEIRPQHYAFLVSESEFDQILIKFANGRFPIGLILLNRKRVRSITTTPGADFISRIPTATCSRSLPDLTAAAAGIPDSGCLRTGSDQASFLMQALDFMAENSVAPERAHPGGLGEVVHENVVAFLGIGPEIEDLGNRGDISRHPSIPGCCPARRPDPGTPPWSCLSALGYHQQRCSRDTNALLISRGRP